MAAAAAVSLRRPLTRSHAVSTGAKRVWNGGDVPPVRAGCREWQFWSDPAGRSLVALGQHRGPLRSFNAYRKLTAYWRELTYRREGAR